MDEPPAERGLGYFAQFVAALALEDRCVPLDLRPTEARAQWRAIQQRQVPAVGRRQVDFAPVETLRCLAASLLVNHRRYGGSTAHQAAEPVATLARLFRRPNSSVLAKMANLDGSRSNGARHEVEVAARLLSIPGELAATYRLILHAAREAGIDERTLPDFLDLGDGDTLELLGQEELSEADVESAVQADSTRGRRQRPDVEERTTERLLVATARVGQHRFAGEVLRNHGHRCVFCGLRVALSGARAARMLVASHIKAWHASTPAERLDVRNGFAACPTHDVAFDTGLITVNGDMRIHVRQDLHVLARTDPATRAAFGRPPLGEQLLLPAGASLPDHRYLAWHHTNMYRSVPASAPA